MTMSQQALVSNDDLSNTLGMLSNVLQEMSQRMKADKEEAEQRDIKTRQAVAGLQSNLDDFKDVITTEVDGIKDSQYLEPWQAANVVDAAKKMVAFLLNNHCDDSGKDKDEVFNKYFGKFVRRVHNDAKLAGLEIGKIIYTPKRNYNMLLEFIGKWYPTRGVEGLMEYYDKKSESK